jgi:hypothetical protein
VFDQPHLLIERVKYISTEDEKGSAIFPGTGDLLNAEGLNKTFSFILDSDDHGYLLIGCQEKWAISI